jgi:N-acetyl-alpha-D-muramate 1-phosphate uridylyltransferase
LRAADVKRAVVNVHYLAEQIEAWARRQSAPAITISDERAKILDTGGGVALALPLLGPAPFFVINSDSFWIDGKVPALTRLRAAWDDAVMDCLLLVAPLPLTVGYGGPGDFVCDATGRLSRRAGASGVPLAYIGGYLVHPRLFEGAPPAKFSMNLLWDRAIARGRLFGVVHDGLWLHVGSPEAIAVAEAAMPG